MALLAAAMLVAGCGSTVPAPTVRPAASEAPPRTPFPTRLVHDGTTPIERGDPILASDLDGRILFDDFDDVFAMNVDGSNLVTIAAEAGSEFDGAGSPDGEWVVYRDSTRGINQDDEIVVARADGSERRTISNDPANDWGPDWSPDGGTIVFNSDRGAGNLAAWLVDPDGSNLRRAPIDGWVEYPSFSPDGTRIAFMGHAAGDYEIFVGDLRSGRVQQLTDNAWNDGWPVWSPDGTRIAFSSTRDDCRFRDPVEPCWRTGEPGEHRDIWLINAEGTDERRVSPEYGQFVGWSPDSRHLLVSGHTLFVIRPDGTGRRELRADEIDLPLGGIPDWR